ncbi:MAG TPA: hypothetical protein VFQ35_21145, partial [Polyangiaceae bacterium]|nr:hypothetical protein [Polyangiaceae bacterium]
MRVIQWLGIVASSSLVAIGGLLVALAPSARAQSTPTLPPGLPLPQQQEQQRFDILASLDFLRDRPPGLCYLPAPTALSDIDVHRSLFVHDRATLDANGGGLFT